MARNWLRSCTVSIDGKVVVTGGGPTDLRVKFAIKQWHQQAPNMCCIRVYNPAPSTVTALKAKEGAKIELAGGYLDNTGVLFAGDLKQSLSGHETAVDSYVELFAADADQGYNKARVTKTLAAGYTPQDKLQVAIDAMAPFGVTLGLNTLDLSRPRYPRGLPMIGMARDIVRQVALSAGGLWSIQMGQVKLTPKTLDSSSSTVTLDSTTGLIGWPVQTQDGILVRSLINPALQPLMKIKLDPSKIIAAEQNNNPFDPSSFAANQALKDQALGAGTYTIFHMDRFGDTRAQDWYDESLCIGFGGIPNQYITSNNYSLGTS